MADFDMSNLPIIPATSVPQVGYNQEDHVQGAQDGWPSGVEVTLKLSETPHKPIVSGHRL